jgi:response regulator RpfG family c-di-GMP phosphodiesterase
MAPHPPWLLLVDDEPGVLHALRRLLKNRYSIATATSAEEGARIAAVSDFAAVLTDYDLPGRNGAWLLVQLATRPGLRKVLTSGRDIPGLEALSSAGVVDRFLKKPASPEEVLQALED